MAWWDHEELKPTQYRSDKYKVNFPDEYTQKEVRDAQRNLDDENTSQRNTRVRTMIEDAKVLLDKIEREIT